MPEFGEKLDARSTFMSKEGFVLYTDIGQRILDHVTAQTVPEFSSEQHLMSKNDIPYGQGVMRLFVAKEAATQLVPIVDTGNPEDSDLHKICGITDHDIDAVAPHTYEGGLVDMYFPWHFAGGMAAASVFAFQRKGKIDQQTIDNMALKDWADIIRSGWFSRLSHNFAHTGNGILETFGANTRDYQPLNLKYRLDGFAQNKGVEFKGVPNVLDVVDGPTGHEYSAVVSEPYRDLLRTYRRNFDTINGEYKGARSVGCPVAKRAAILPTKLVAENPHAQSLINEGILDISPSKRPEIVIATQQDTVIDRTFQVIANQLEEYEATYGTPYLVKDDAFAEVVHSDAEPLNIFAPKCPVSH